MVKSVEDFDPAALKEVRRAAGLSLADIGAAIGSTQGTVGRWESGKGAPSPRLFAALTDALGVPKSALLVPLAADADLAVLRTRAGLRQEDVAEALGIQASDVSEMEQGTGGMRDEWGVALSEIYDVTPEQLARARAATEAAWRARFDARRKR
ncbi:MULTISPECIES: helix-turn-helix domain-containing protein [Streptomyces]|uniref:Helix-turn-helix domain-containing protein n=1 Tax=Streptomyces ramulosus TaxID=47762 RepID=A0ABW1FLB8_9ACTN